MKRFAVVALVFVLAVAAAGLALAAKAQDPPPPGEVVNKVEICHFPPPPNGRTSP